MTSQPNGAAGPEGAKRNPRRPRLDVVPAGSGLLLVDKPAGMTSHDVVSQVRRLAATRRVGHGGTLDPMATGLLVLGVNAGTKLLQYVTGLSKTYLATIRLGVATSTDDFEGEVTRQTNVGFELSAGALDLHLEHYRGDIMQVPTSVSAIKVDGKRAYALVREGSAVELAARPITVHRFEIIGEPRQSQAPRGTRTVDFDVVVECSSGTYIRALARDIGVDLGVGGHLTALRRTTTGPWTVNEADTLAELTEVGEGGGPLRVLSMGRACEVLFSQVLISDSSARRFMNGQAPGPEDVLELIQNERANPKFADVYAVRENTRPDQVLGLVRMGKDATLGLKTVTVFPEGTV